MKRGILFAILTFPFPLFPMDGAAYRGRLEQGDPRLSADLKAQTSRITNRETAFVVARHFALFLGDGEGARGLLPAGGMEPHEETLLGFMEEAAGRPGDALFHYDRAWARSGHTYGRAVVAAQKLLLSQGAYAEARKRGVEALPEIGQQGDLALVRMAVHLALGDGRAAETFLSRSPLWGPRGEDRFRYFQFRALIWEAMGSNATARTCWRTAHLLQPEDPLSRMKVEQLTTLLAPDTHWLDDLSRSRARPSKNPGGESAEDSGDGDGNSTPVILTPAQVRNQAQAILKLVQGPALSPRGVDLHREAWDRIEGLEASGGSALVSRLLWTAKAQVAWAARRPEMAKGFLERALRCPPTALLEPVFVSRLQDQVDAQLTSRRAAVRERAARGADLDPVNLARKLLGEVLTPARLIPIPDPLLPYFDLSEPPSSPTNRAPTSGVEMPEPAGMPTRRIHQLAGRVVGEETWTWDGKGRPLVVECREVNAQGKPGDPWQVTRYEYPEGSNLILWEVTADASGKVLRERSLRSETDGDDSRTVEEVTVDGILTQVTTSKGNQSRVELPAGGLLRETRRFQTNGIWREVVTQGEEILWQDDVTYRGDEPLETGETRRERRDPRGNLMEIVTQRFLGGKAWTRERRDPDGAPLESWRWVW